MKLDNHPMAALDAWRAAHPSEPVRNAVTDHPNGSLTSADALRMGLFGDLSQPGPAVTDSTAMTVGTVYACLSKLGGAVGQLPLHEFTGFGSERQRVSPPSALWWLLNESPAPAWTASTWKNWIVRCVKLRGDQHTEILRRGTQAVGFKIHHPDNVVVSTVNGRLRYACRDVETGRAYGVDQDDMLHFTGFGFDGERSLSAIKWAARSAIAGELGASRYMLKTVSEGAMPRIALEYPTGMTPDQANDLRASFRAIYGRNDGSTLPLVLQGGGKAHELSISPVDLELLQTRRMDKQAICEVMGVPPIIIGDSEKTSSWGTGVEQVTLGWIRFDLQPMIGGWEEELNRKLFRRAGRMVEFSFEGLLRGDSKAQAEAFRAALGGPGTGDGWMSVEEVRALKNMPTTGDPAFAKPYKAVRDASATNSAPPAPTP